VTVLAQHSTATPEHGTPREIVEMARYVLGEIEADACSSRYWNTHSVRAGIHFDADNSPLDAAPWTIPPHSRPAYDTWLVNPPGGLVKEFWRFATARYREGSAVFWVGFSLEQLVYLQKEGALFPGFRRCIPPRRLAFLRKVDGLPPVPGKSPTHGNWLCLMPNDAKQIARFEEASLSLGAAEVW
jgi:hypothetical protein